MNLTRGETLSVRETTEPKSIDTKNMSRENQATLERHMLAGGQRALKSLFSVFNSKRTCGLLMSQKYILMYVCTIDCKD